MRLVICFPIEPPLRSLRRNGGFSFCLSALFPDPTCSVRRFLLTTHDTYNSWPIKIYTTCIRSGSDGEPATYNSYAYCLCNADGSAGTYADLARCGANCGGKKGPVSVQAQGRTPEESLERVRAKYPRLMTKLAPLLSASIRSSLTLRTAYATYCADGRLTAKAQSYLRNHLIPVLGKTPISEISAAVLYDAVKAIAAADEAGHATNEERNRHIRYVEQLFVLLRQDNCYTADNDPTVDLGQLKHYTKKSRAAGANRRRSRLTDEERSRLMAWCAEHPGRSAAAVALIYNGLSVPELSALNLEDAETLPCGIHCLWITHRMLRSGEKYSAQPVAVSQIRRLPLFAATENALRAFARTLRAPAEERPLVGVGPDGGRRYTPDQVRRDLAQLLTELAIDTDAVSSGTPSVRPEQAESLLLHDAAHCMSDKMQLPAEYVAMLLGRPQPTTNGRHYLDLDCDDTQIALHRLARRMFSASDSSPEHTAKAALSPQRPVCTVGSDAGRCARAVLRTDRPCHVEIVSPFGFSILNK